MEKAKNVFSNMLENKWTIFYILFASAVFIGIVYYVYYYYIKSSFSNSYTDNRELIDPNESDGTIEKKASLYLFKTEWCPHCKKILQKKDDSKQLEDGAWIKVKMDPKLRVINDYNINYVEIDGDDDKSITAWESEYLQKQNKKIDGFPSIYLVKDDQVIEFDANPTHESLEKFLNTVI